MPPYTALRATGSQATQKAQRVAAFQALSVEMNY